MLHIFFHYAIIYYKIFPAFSGIVFSFYNTEWENIVKIMLLLVCCNVF